MLSLVADLLFFCVLGIFGLTFEGSESSPVYKLFMAGNGGLVIALTIIGIMKGEIKTTISFWTLLILLPIFVLGCYFWQVPVYNLNMENARQFMLLMVCFSYTACCIGIYIAHQGIAHFAKYMDIIMLIMTMSFFSAILATIAGGASIGGAGYQAMAYMSAFAFCINICMILWGDKYERFPLFTGKKWNMISYILLVIQLLTCLLSGGRGGFVLLALGTGYMMYRSRKLGKLLTMGVFAILIAVAAASFSDTALSETLSKSTFRTFDYMRGDAENLKKVSGRSYVYEHALDIIQKDNYLGRGLFRSIEEGYPHNFFLEVGEQGGVLYILFWCSVIVMIIRETNQRIKSEDAHIMIPIMAYPFVLLIFSGSYTICTLFWFVVSYTWTRHELIQY